MASTSDLPIFGSILQNTMHSFVTKLMHYNKQSIIGIGQKLIWEMLEGKARIPPGFETIYNFLDAYGSRIIILSMAVSSNYNPVNLTENGFYQLFYDYFNINESIIVPSFLEIEAQKVIRFLKREKTNKIPERFIDLQIIHSACKNHLYLVLLKYNIIMTYQI